ncbi:MAG TPA: winged helix-turn-helix transcriptional regulator [Thermoanaerobaculia bacterium]|nr:winged helix-turn-helix transcriptional regulator [Thermoanaerobaculia bacterium]
MQKTYDQYCAVAKALDLVGERWTLLLVRELTSGAKRYSDLLGGTPGIATDVLAARLRKLEESGVIARRTLPPPAASVVYELTESGRALTPVLRELAKWGLQFLGKRKGEAFHIDWLAHWLHVMFRSDRAQNTTLVLQFESGGEAMHARIENGAMETHAGPADVADVIIAGDMSTLAQAAHDRAASDEALARGRMRVTGKKQDVKKVLEVLGLKEPR